MKSISGFNPTWTSSYKWTFSKTTYIGNFYVSITHESYVSHTKTFRVIDSYVTFSLIYLFQALNLSISINDGIICMYQLAQRYKRSHPHNGPSSKTFANQKKPNKFWKDIVLLSRHHSDVTLTIQNKHLSKIDMPCITENWLITLPIMVTITLRWRHNEHDGVSNHEPLDCLLKCLFRRTSKKTPKLRVTGLCEGIAPVTGEFPAQRASNAENVSIWWRHHELQVKFVHTWTKLSGGPSKII